MRFLVRMLKVELGSKNVINSSANSLQFFRLGLGFPKSLEQLVEGCGDRGVGKDGKGWFPTETGSESLGM